MNFKKLFTESKKLAVPSFSGAVKLARTPKSCKILYLFGLLIISITKLRITLQYGSK